MRTLACELLDWRCDIASAATRYRDVKRQPAKRFLLNDMKQKAQRVPAENKDEFLGEPYGL